MNFVLPSLTYTYDAMEPFIDKKTMEIHHTKHHQAYIDNANIALSNIPEFSNLSISEIIQKLSSLPDNNIKKLLRNNAGGHINHTLFWKFLKYGTTLKGSLKKAIEHNFSSIDNFKKKFEQTAMSRFGSGWVWLVKKNGDVLDIHSTPNQDNPLMGMDIVGFTGYPILGLDVWEHAYYLKYQNKRLDYIQAFWNIVNWDEVSCRFNKNF